MPKIPYIQYKDLKEFYTIPELYKLFNMDKQLLKKKCAQYGIDPRRNEIGDYGFVKYDVRKLHNMIYHEERNQGSPEDDPWS